MVCLIVVGLAAIWSNTRRDPEAKFCTMALAFVVIDGKRYSHIVDPRTGIGLTDHCSVTVVGPNGLSTDPLGKAVAILGPKTGLRLVDQIPGMAALITRAPEGALETFLSSRWKDLRAVEVKPQRPTKAPTP